MDSGRKRKEGVIKKQGVGVQEKYGLRLPRMAGDRRRDNIRISDGVMKKIEAAVCKEKEEMKVH